MSSTSSINTVSNSGNKNYIAGLASGMDTESMVQSMLSGTQSKIDKQTGLKQQLEWKQDIYRSLILLLRKRRHEPDEQQLIQYHDRRQQLVEYQGHIGFRKCGQQHEDRLD